MNRTTTAVVLALLLASDTAQASEWVLVGKTDTGEELFVDVSSIEVTGKVGRAWIKLVLPPHTERGAALHETKWVRQFLKRDVFNCSEQTSNPDAVTIYYDDGTNYSEPATAFPRWKPVQPESMESVAMQLICNRKPGETTHATD
jgi:Surface-adhesin protein E